MFFLRRCFSKALAAKHLLRNAADHTLVISPKEISSATIAAMLRQDLRRKDIYFDDPRLTDHERKEVKNQFTGSQNGVFVAPQSAFTELWPENAPRVIVWNTPHRISTPFSWSRVSMGPGKGVEVFFLCDEENTLDFRIHSEAPDGLGPEELRILDGLSRWERRMKTDQLLFFLAGVLCEALLDPLWRTDEGFGMGKNWSWECLSGISSGLIRSGILIPIRHGPWKDTFKARPQRSLSEPACYSGEPVIKFQS